MGNEIEATLLQPDSPSWASDVDALREALGAPNNVYLIPPHFLKATLPKIGGKIATITKGGEPIGTESGRAASLATDFTDQLR